MSETATLALVPFDAAAAEVLDLARHEYVYTEGARADRVYRVRLGQVLVGRTSLKGYDIASGLVGPGELFGIEEVVAGRDRDSWARVVSLAARLEAIAARDFLARVKPAELAEALAHQLAARERYHAETKRLSARFRIAAVLGDHALRLGKSVHLRHEDLAALAGCTRETATRTVNRLTELGVLEQPQNGRLYISAPERLVLPAGKPVSGGGSNAQGTKDPRVDRS